MARIFIPAAVVAASALLPCAVNLVRAQGQMQPQQQPQQQYAPQNQQAGPPSPQQPAALPSSNQAPPGGAPFQLTPQEEAALDEVLQAWQRNQVKTYTCKFKRWEYDYTFGPKDKEFLQAMAFGEIKYKAPDKGLFRVDELKVYNQEKNSYEPSKDFLEQWITDGKTIFEFDAKEKLLKEHPLPPQLQGEGITNGPLPFLFGVEAAKLKQRYFMRRIAVPKDAQGQIWLEAHPRFQQDAANFILAEIILHEQELVPFAVQLYLPGGQSRTVYQFDKHSNLSKFFEGDFSRPSTPFGWKRVTVDTQNGSTGTPTAQTKSKDSSQVKRVLLPFLR